MRTTVFIPSAFLNFTGRNRIIRIEGSTAGEVLNNLTEYFYPLRRYLYSENGRIKSFINVYVNDKDIKILQDEDTVLKEDDVIKIIPTISGGIN